MWSKDGIPNLCRIYKEAKAFKEWVSTLRTRLDVDMDAKFQQCYNAREELTGILTATNSIRTSTAEAQNIKSSILEQLREVRIMINVRMQEASEYKHAMLRRKESKGGFKKLRFRSREPLIRSLVTSYKIANMNITRFTSKIARTISQKSVCKTMCKQLKHCCIARALTINTSQDSPETQSVHIAGQLAGACVLIN